LVKQNFGKTSERVADDLQMRWCSNLVWYVNKVIRTERAPRTRRLHVRDFQGESKAEEGFSVSPGVSGSNLTELGCKEVETVFFYYSIAQVCGSFDTLVVIALPFFWCRASRGLTQLLPFYGLLASSFSMGALMSSSAFISSIKTKEVLFSFVRRVTVVSSLVMILCWVLLVVVFLNIFTERFSQLILLLVARFGLGLCSGVQQCVPLAFLRHLSANAASGCYKPRDDLSTSFGRLLLGPGISLCSSLGLPSLTPSDYNPTLRLSSLFNSLTIGSFLGLAMATTIFTAALRLPSDNAMGHSNHHSRNNHERLAQSEETVSATEFWCSPILQADAAIHAVIWGTTWSILFLFKVPSVSTVFDLFVPIFVGCLCAIIVNPKTVLGGLLRLDSYRLGYSFSSASRGCCLLGVLTLIAAQLCIAIQPSAPFAPMFLFGMALFLISNSEDRIELLRPTRTAENERSVAFEFSQRTSAKTWGRMVGSLISGVLLESRGDSGECSLRWLEYWAALNIVFLLFATVRLALPCCAENEASLRGGVRIAGDPDSICASLAEGAIDIDIDIDIA